ncbi:MAG: RNA polymerase factor sigma-54 [Chloroflexaceae bacterium]
MPHLAMIVKQELRAMPALLTVARMLELPVLELHQAVQEELAANPALEEFEQPPAAAPSAPVSDPLLRVAAPVSIADTLLADLRASLPADQHALAEALVGNLDEHGFLPESPATLARELGVPRAQVEAALRLLRDLGPPGIATRGPRECLLAQLDALASAGERLPLVRAIVAEHLEDLAAGRYRAIARALEVDESAVVSAHTLMQQQLWPFPFQAILTERAGPDRRVYRAPDLIFTACESGFAVEVPTGPGRWLGLNPVYTELATRAAELSATEREHVLTYVARARTFLNGLRRRYATLRRIGEALAVRQAAFLREGPARLVPLTRLQLARDVGLHASTVCRALADKIALLPNHALVSLDDFFNAARPLQEALRDLIATEQEPLSDQELAELLAARGYPIARRTVARYREQLGIPAQRRRARRQRDH